MTRQAPESPAAGAAATRARLLDAAVECLIAHGVAGTTTLAVQRRAGVSRGALLHHFPTHAALLAATVTELVERNERAVALSRLDIGRCDDPLEQAIRAIAFAGRQPAALAELELWAVARTDQTLRHALIAAERAARSDLDRVYSDLFGRWSGSAAYDDAIALTLHFIRGLTISETIQNAAHRRERLIATWARTMRSMLEGGMRPGIGESDDAARPEQARLKSQNKT